MSEYVEKLFKNAILTGSYAYGIPHEKSDIDLVVMIDKETLDRIEHHGKDAKFRDEYISAGGRPLQFGKLNLICCTNEKYFEVWRKGTKRLKKMAPVTRDFAIEFFRKMRLEAGFYV